MGNGPYRNDPLWVNLYNVLIGVPMSIKKVAYEGVGPEIVSLDVVKVRGVLECGVFPVELLHPPNLRSVGVRPDIKPINLLIFGYPWRISRMLHLKCLT